MKYHWLKLVKYATHSIIKTGTINPIKIVTNSLKLNGLNINQAIINKGKYKILIVVIKAETLNQNEAINN